MRDLRVMTLRVGLVCLFLGLPFLLAQADEDDDSSSISVGCNSPMVSAPAGGGTVTVNVDCLINAPNAGPSYRITAADNNFMAPRTIYLSRGLNFLTATLQPAVLSPDNTVTSISGTSSGFTAGLSSSPTPKTIRFQYSVTTTSATPTGNYLSLLNPAYYRFRICRTPACNKNVSTGTAPASLNVRVISSPVSVSCSSAPVNAVPGGGTFALDVLCTIAGGNPDKFFPVTQNVFSPAVITLSNGTANLNANLQPTVSSPDSSVSGISGTAGGGFSANINAMPAKIQVKYQGSTTVNSPAGTYTSPPVSFTWSTL
ncbi:hypothetical protein [Vampirovibrio sp.]|uniref:hypothetical protein n=1 Tax=Vampirovibrio sp. TaxID=2717857 RepID=UPI003592F8E9